MIKDNKTNELKDEVLENVSGGGDEPSYCKFACCESICAINGCNKLRKDRDSQKEKFYCSLNHGSYTIHDDYKHDVKHFPHF